MTNHTDTNRSAGDKQQSQSELYLVLDKTGEILPVSSLPTNVQQPVASFVVDAGKVTLKIESGSPGVFVNGRKIDDSVLLSNGDRVRAGPLILNFASDGRGGILYLQARDTNSTLPPGEEESDGVKSWVLTSPDTPGDLSVTAKPSATEISAQKIVPGSFSRSTQRLDRKDRFRPLPMAIVAGFLILAALAAFMFSATAVRVVIEPMPDKFDVDGAWLSFELGGRYLLLQGDARVSAQKQGYHPLRETFRVDGSANQEVLFQLNRLPDYFRIQSTPVAISSVRVDDRDLGVTPLSDIDLESGEHELLLRADRYLDHRQTIQVEGGGHELSLTIEMLPAWANYELTSVPSVARVFVDDLEIGSTPLTVELLQGSRQLKISRKGFKTWQENIDVIAGNHQLLPVTLLKADGKVSVRSNPPGASVTVNRQYRGRTPLSIALAPDREYQLAFSLAGHRNATRNLRVRSDQDASVLVNLQALVGLVTVKSEPAGATVKVDGVNRGETNLQLKLSAQPHLIEFSKPGFAPFHARVTPRPGFEQQLVAHLKTLEQARWESIPKTIETAAGQKLNLIKGGRIDMGTPRRQPGRRSNEIEHPVVLEKPFYLGTHEVSNAEFRKFSREHNSGAVKKTSLNQNTHPVVQISWQDAARYCNWLSEKDGLPPAYVAENDLLVGASPMTTGYRLPTEAEWAMAQRQTRQGVKNRYPWGENLPPLSGSGNFADNSARMMVSVVIEGYDDKYAATSPTGSFDATDTGFFDLAGNVAEWVHDYYSADPLRAGKLTTDPLGPASGEYYVVRGSSWTSGGVSELRVGFRDYAKDPRDDLGFRLARYLE